MTHEEHQSFWAVFKLDNCIFGTEGTPLDQIHIAAARGTRVRKMASLEKPPTPFDLVGRTTALWGGLMHKDFGLALSAATRAGLSLPAVEAAAAVNAAETVRDAEEDFSAVVRRMEWQVASESALPPAA